MKKIIKDVGLAISITSGGIGIAEWVKRKAEYNSKLNKVLNENAVQSNKIEELRSGNKLDSVMYEKNNLDLKDALGEVAKEGKSYIADVDKNGGSCVTESCKKLFSNFQEKIEEAKKIAEKVDIDDIKNKLSSDNWIDKYKEFIETLSDEQLFSIIHISFLVGLLIIINNFVITYYSDYIIKYFSLESKYPKIARFIELRRKFQFYYMSLNIIIMILIVITLFIFNFLVLTGFFN